MEKEGYGDRVVRPPGYGSVSSGSTDQRHSFVDSMLTDAVLNELKRQSINGCLLCFFDTWDEQEWD